MHKKSATPKQRRPAVEENAGAEIGEKETVIKPHANDDPVFAIYGEPFITNDKGTVHLNQRAVAVKCATEYMVRYDPTLKAYQRFDKESGLWLPIHEVQVRRLLGDLLLTLGQQWHQQEFVQLNNTSQFNSLCKMLQPYQISVASESTIGLMHVSNGVLDMRGKSPKLLPHDPKYAFPFSPRIKYDPKAKCPRFLQEFLCAALEPMTSPCFKNIVDPCCLDQTLATVFLLSEAPQAAVRARW